MTGPNRPTGRQPPALVRGIHRIGRPRPRAHPRRARAPDEHTSQAHAARALARTRLVRLGVVLVAASILSPLIGSQLPGKAFAVATGSMEPAIPVGAIVATAPKAPVVGDVVVYWSPLGEYQIHRVVGEATIEGRSYWTTRGDANDSPDSFAVPKDDVVGVVQATIPGLGVAWLLPLGLKLLIFAGLVFIYAGITLWDARPWWRAPRAAVISTMLAGLLLLPSAGAAILPSWADSTTTADVADPTPLPMAAGTMGSASITSDQNGATANAAAPRLWSEIVLWSCRPQDAACGMALTGTSYTSDLGSKTFIDAGKWKPAPTFYLEAYIKAPSGNTASVILRNNDDGTDIAGSEVSTASTELTRVRSASFTLSSSKEYVIRTKLASSGPDGELAMAKLILVQDTVGFGSTLETETFVRLSSGSQTTATSYAVPSRAGKWRFDGSAMDGVNEAWFEFVGSVSAQTNNDNFVRLVDRTDGTVVAEEKISKSQTTPARVQKSGIDGSLVDGHEYEVEFRSGGGSANFRLHLARVILHQVAFAKTVRYVDLAWTATTAATTYAGVGYDGRYMGTERGPATGFFEATVSNTDSGGTTSVQMADRATGGPVSGSEVSATGTARTRTRSGAINLGSDVDYGAQFKASAGTATILNAWLIVHQTAGKTYDHILKTRNDVAGSCAWSFSLAHTSSTGLARLTEARVSLRGDASPADQVVVLNGALTQTSGSAVTVPFGSSLQHVAFTKPSSTGTSSISASLTGQCVGSGIRTIQSVTYSLT